MIAIAKGQITAFAANGFTIRNEEGVDVQIRTMARGDRLGLVLGERVSVSGGQGTDGAFWSSSIHVLDPDGRWAREVQDRAEPEIPAPKPMPVSPASKLPRPVLLIVGLVGLVMVLLGGQAVLSGMKTLRGGGGGQIANGPNTGPGFGGEAPYGPNGQPYGPNGPAEGPNGQPYGPNEQPYGPPDGPGAASGPNGAYGPNPYGPPAGPPAGGGDWPGAGMPPAGPGAPTGPGGPAGPGGPLPAKAPPAGFTKAASSVGVVLRAPVRPGEKASQTAQRLSGALAGYFDGPVQVMNRQGDPQDQRTQWMFSAMSGGAPVSGIIAVQTEGPGGGAGYVIYDQSDRIQTSVPMLFQAIDADVRGRGGQ